jgi:hypothetical protein
MWITTRNFPSKEFVKIFEIQILAQILYIKHCYSTNTLKIIINYAKIKKIEEQAKGQFRLLVQILNNINCPSLLPFSPIVFPSFLHKKENSMRNIHFFLSFSLLCIDLLSLEMINLFH